MHRLKQGRPTNRFVQRITSDYRMSIRPVTQKIVRCVFFEKLGSQVVFFYAKRSKTSGKLRATDDFLHQSVQYRSTVYNEWLHFRRRSIESKGLTPRLKSNLTFCFCLYAVSKSCVKKRNNNNKKEL